MKLKHLSILFAIIGILILYSLSTLSKPKPISISKIPEYEGKEVIITGIATDYFTTQQGSQIITIKQKNHTTKIFSEEAIDIEKGDKIQAQGGVQKYQGEYEIIVNNKDYLKIIKKWDRDTTTLQQLTEKPEKYINLNVNVTGKIKEIYGNLIYLTDINETYIIPAVFSNITQQNLQTNQKITIHATFEYDETNFRYQLKSKNS
jgi:DNA/RNA endonuclease YhcR with UshA esterase domain